MLDENVVKDFWEYVEYYSDESEPGYDGVHWGMKGIREDAPETAKKAYRKYRKMMADAEKRGIIY